MNGGEEERRGKKQDREELLFISHFGSSVGVLSISFLYNSWHLGHQFHISLAKKVCSGFSVMLQGKSQMNFLANAIYCQGWWKSKEKIEVGMVTSETEEVRLLILRTLIPLSCCPPLHQVSFAQVGGGGLDMGRVRRHVISTFLPSQVRGPVEATTDAWGQRERSVP